LGIPKPPFPPCGSLLVSPLEETQKITPKNCHAAA